MSGFLLIILVAIVAGGIGYWLGRRSAEQHNLFPAGQVPLQQRDGPKEYYRPYADGSGYADGPGYPPQQQGYMPQQQGYMPQRQGMNPWMAGGLGAVGGGLVGYGLGQAMNDNEPASSADAVPADAQGGIEGSFGDIADFGGGEW